MRPGASTRSAAVMRARSRAGGASGASRSSPAAAWADSRSYSRSDTGANVTLSPAASNAGGAFAHVPQGGRRAREDVPAARTLLRIDDRHGHGDGNGAARHLHARVLAPRQRELGRQTSEIGQARQEAHHVDELDGLAVALDDLGDAEAGALGDLGEIEAEALIVAGGDAPAPACDLGGLQALQQRRDGVLQIRMGKLQGIVVHHERAEGRHHLDDAREPRGLQLLPQRQHERAQVRIDTVAELHDQGRIAGGEKAGLRGGWHARQQLLRSRSAERR